MTSVARLRAVHRVIEWGRAVPRLRVEHWLVGIATLVLLLLVAPPFLTLARSSVLVGERLGRSGVLSLGAYEQILTSPGLLGLIGGTIFFAVGSTIVGLLLGGTLAWLVQRTNAPFTQWVYAATFVSFAVPGILRTIGWIFLLGPRTGAINELFKMVSGTDHVLLDVFTLPAMIVIEGIYWIPIVFLMMSAAFISMDPTLEEAAYLSGASKWQTLRRVTTRLVWPSVLSVLLLTFVRTIQTFEVPLLLGVPAHIRILTTEVYLSIQGSLMPDYSYSSAYGVLLLVVLMPCLYLYARATRHSTKYATITGKAFRPRVIDLGRWRYVAGAFVAAAIGVQFLPVLYLVFASFLPTFGLKAQLWEQLTLNNYSTVLRNPAIAASVWNSFIIATVSATVVTLFMAVVAWLIVRSRVRLRKVLDPLSSLPLIFPGVVMGVAILMLFIRFPLPIYGTIWLLAIAYVISFLPYGLRYVHPSVLQIHPELEESAQLSGASWGQSFVRVTIPLLLPALFAGWIFVFLISMRELSIAALLYTAKSTVIATTMLDLWANANVNQVSAFGSLVATGGIAFAIVAYRISRRWGIQA